MPLAVVQANNQVAQCGSLENLERQAATYLRVFLGIRERELRFLRPGDLADLSSRGGWCLLQAKPAGDANPRLVHLAIPSIVADKLRALLQARSDARIAKSDPLFKPKTMKKLVRLLPHGARHTLLTTALQGPDVCGSPARTYTIVHAQCGHALPNMPVLQDDDCTYAGVAATMEKFTLRYADCVFAAYRPSVTPNEAREEEENQAQEEDQDTHAPERRPAPALVPIVTALASPAEKPRGVDSRLLAALIEILTKTPDWPASDDAARHQRLYHWYRTLVVIEGQRSGQRSFRLIRALSSLMVNLGVLTVDLPLTWRASRTRAGHLLHLRADPDPTASAYRTQTLNMLQQVLHPCTPEVPDEGATISARLLLTDTPVVPEEVARISALLLLLDIGGPQRCYLLDEMTWQDIDLARGLVRLRNGSRKDALDGHIAVPLAPATVVALSLLNRHLHGKPASAVFQQPVHEILQPAVRPSPTSPLAPSAGSQNRSGLKLTPAAASRHWRDCTPGWIVDALCAEAVSHRPILDPAVLDLYVATRFSPSPSLNTDRLRREEPRPREPRRALCEAAQAAVAKAHELIVKWRDFPDRLADELSGFILERLDPVGYIRQARGGPTADLFATFHRAAIALKKVKAESDALQLLNMATILAGRTGQASGEPTKRRWAAFFWPAVALVNVTTEAVQLFNLAAILSFVAFRATHVAGPKWLKNTASTPSETPAPSSLTAYFRDLVAVARHMQGTIITDWKDVGSPDSLCLEHHGAHASVTRLAITLAQFRRFLAANMKFELKARRWTVARGRPDRRSVPFPGPGQLAWLFATLKKEPKIGDDLVCWAAALLGFGLRVEEATSMLARDIHLGHLAGCVIFARAAKDRESRWCPLGYLPDEAYKALQHRLALRKSESTPGKDAPPLLAASGSHLVVQRRRLYAVMRECGMHPHLLRHVYVTLRHVAVVLGQGRPNESWPDWVRDAARDLDSIRAAAAAVGHSTTLQTRSRYDQGITWHATHARAAMDRELLARPLTAGDRRRLLCASPARLAAVRSVAAVSVFVHAAQPGRSSPEPARPARRPRRAGDVPVLAAPASRSSRENHLLLVDGHHLFYRAYYALSARSASGPGAPVRGVSGFAGALRKLIRDFAPTHLCVPFDPPEPPFRRVLFPGYRTGRPRGTDEEVAGIDDQVSQVLQLLDLAGIRHPMIAGYEADDALGTLATLAAARRLRTTIVSGDRDLLQLVRPYVTVVLHTPGKRQAFDQRLVQERWGVPSSLFADLKALMGDQPDCIPGVPGIGPKHAATLLQQYGDVYGLYHALDKLTGAPAKGSPLTRFAAALSESRKQVMLNLRLVTIVTTLDVPADLDVYRWLGTSEWTGSALAAAAVVGPCD